jgi:hypothetical protein
MTQGCSVAKKGIPALEHDMLKTSGGKFVRLFGRKRWRFMIFSESAMSTEGVQLLGARTESIGRRRRRD